MTEPLSQLASVPNTEPLITRALEESLPDKAVSIHEALTAIVRCEGNLGLAAVNLRTRPSNIMAAIVQDPNNHDLMARYLRAYTSLKMFTTLNELGAIVEEAIHDLAPKDAIKNYTALIEAFSRMSEHEAGSAAPVGANPVDTLLRTLPPQIRDAFQVLASQGSKTPGLIEIVDNEEVA